MTSLTAKSTNHLATYLQTAMVIALVAGVVGFLAATWSPSISPDLRAERAQVSRNA